MWSLIGSNLDFYSKCQNLYNFLHKFDLGGRMISRQFGHVSIPLIQNLASLLTANPSSLVKLPTAMIELLTASSVVIISILEQLQSLDTQKKFLVVLLEEINFVGFKVLVRVGDFGHQNIL